jgi:hypothetical protein
VAKYPRIVVSPEAQQLFESESSLRTDFDGMRHLDILRPYKPAKEQITWLEGLQALAARRAEQDADKLERVAKHRWFHGYVTETLVRARQETAG